MLEPIEDREYFKAMVDQCREVADREWDEQDRSYFKMLQIPARELYLKEWFSCAFCQVRTENCPVYQEKLNNVG